MLIYTDQKSKRKPKMTAKKKQLQASWKQLMEKWDVKPDNKKISSKQSYSGVSIPTERSTRHLPSIDTGIGNTSKKESPKYTGDAVVGISTLHKSNAIPVFSQEEAIDISKMRR
jgi:hypothetical protein